LWPWGEARPSNTAKIVADRAGVPVIVIPTIASTDAPCSGCAVLYSRGGVFETVSIRKTNPAAVLVDVDVIAAAPPRFLVGRYGRCPGHMVRGKVLRPHPIGQTSAAGLARGWASYRQALLRDTPDVR
jgi:glycerol dehydrogenase